jgi:hypothetical protein
MILKVLSIGAIALLLLLRLARTRVGARLLGVSLQVLNIVYLAALGVAGVLAVMFEQWILLTVVVILLVVSLVEELRRRAAARV